MMATLLARAFALYRAHFFLIASLTVVVWLPCDLIQCYLEYYVLEPDDFRRSFQLTRFFDSFVGIIATTGILYSLEQSASGITPTFASAIGAGFSFWPRMWWARFVYGLLLLVGVLLLVVPGFILWVRCSLLEAVVVRERVTGGEAIGRSWVITKGHFWRLIGWFLVAGIMAFAASLPFLLLTLLPMLDEWIPSAVLSTLFAVPLAYLTVFMWVVLDHIQKTELPVQPASL